MEVKQVVVVSVIDSEMKDLVCYHHSFIYLMKKIYWKKKKKKNWCPNQNDVFLYIWKRKYFVYLFRTILTKIVSKTARFYVTDFQKLKYFIANPVVFSYPKAMNVVFEFFTSVRFLKNLLKFFINLSNLTVIGSRTLAVDPSRYSESWNIHY